MSGLDEAFDNAEILSPKKTSDEVTDGNHKFVVKNYEVKTWDNGEQSVSLHFYFPKFNRMMFDSYSATRMKYLKTTLSKLNGLKQTLEASLRAVVNKTGNADVTTNGKYRNIYVTSVDESDDSTPF